MIFVIRLRHKWSDALSNRREFLDTEVRKIMDKGCQNETDSAKQNELIDQWTMLQVRGGREREGGGGERGGGERGGGERGRGRGREREREKSGYMYIYNKKTRCTCIINPLIPSTPVGEDGSGATQGWVRCSRGSLQLAGPPGNGIKGSSDIPRPHKVHTQRTQECSSVHVHVCNNDMYNEGPGNVNTGPI